MATPTQHRRVFNDGAYVRIREAYPIGHYRTPFFVRGKEGKVERFCGAFPNPEELAFGRDGLPKVNLYRVRFRLCDLWHNYEGQHQDSSEIEIFEHWLEPVEAPVNPDHSAQVETSYE